MYKRQDGDAALLFAFVANGGVIAICRGFYRSAIDGNVHFRRVDVYKRQRYA